MQPDPITAGGDKPRAVKHYTALAAEAARIRQPDLAAITGWEYDRRRAVVLLKHQETLARNARRHDAAQAYWSARYDVELLLRKHAEVTISESCTMEWATKDYLGRPQ